MSENELNGVDDEADEAAAVEAGAGNIPAIIADSDVAGVAALPHDDTPSVPESGVTESAASAEESGVAAPSDDKRPQRRPSRAELEAYERLLRRFQACGRCGYLLADCRLLLGEERLREAALNLQNGWIVLESTQTFRPLLVNAYGARMEIDYDAFDGVCPECRRRFVFSTGGAGTILRLHS